MNGPSHNHPLLQLFGAETPIFDPGDPLLPDQIPGDDHPAVHELREHALWRRTWCGAAPSGKARSPGSEGADRPPAAGDEEQASKAGLHTRGQADSGGSQSFNAVNMLRLLGRWMRMFTIPNQSSVPMAYKEFGEARHMKPSNYYDRFVDVMGELAGLRCIASICDATR